MKQGKPALAENGSCRYRMGNSCCAIGCLLPDDLYLEHMEGKGVSDLIGILTYYRAGSSDEFVAGLNRHRELLVSLQTAHDNSRRHSPRDFWLGRFAEIASRYDLTYDLDKHAETYGLKRPWNSL